MFRTIISPILRSTRLCLQLVVYCTDDTASWWPAVHQLAASSVHYTTSCKNSLVLPRMDEIIARSMFSWLKLLIKSFLLHLVDCLCYCVYDARSHKHQIFLSLMLIAKVDEILKLNKIWHENIRGVTGGTDQTSGGCSLCYTIPI